MAWVGAATGRLPLWVEGRAASYSSGDALRLVPAAAHCLGRRRPRRRRGCRAGRPGEGGEGSLRGQGGRRTGQAFSASCSVCRRARARSTCPASAPRRCRTPPSRLVTAFVSKLVVARPDRCSCSRTSTGPTPTSLRLAQERVAALRQPSRSSWSSPAGPSPTPAARLGSRTGVQAAA